jgi:hypothetical protein
MPRFVNPEQISVISAMLAPIGDKSAINFSFYLCVAPFLYYPNSPTVWFGHTLLPTQNNLYLLKIINTKGTVVAKLVNK